MNKLKRMNGRERTFLLITIPILALFFCFNTLPLIKGVIYSFTNFKGYGSYDWVGLRNYKDLFTLPTGLPVSSRASLYVKRMGILLFRTWCIS